MGGPSYDVTFGGGGGGVVQHVRGANKVRA